MHFPLAIIGILRYNHTADNRLIPERDPFVSVCPAKTGKAGRITAGKEDT